MSFRSLGSPELQSSELDMRKRRKPLHRFQARSLPQELVDMIIDIFGSKYDRDALNACSLVCHAWLPRSRSHIHSAVRLDYTSNLEHLQALYTTFLAIYVRSLSIDTCGSDGMPADQSWVDKMQPLLANVTKVERLSIEGIAWSELEENTRALFCTKYPGVTDLWLATCDFADPADLVHLHQAFPLLSSARMEGVSSDDIVFDHALRLNSDTLSLRWLDVGDLCTSPGVLAKWAFCYRKQVSIENIHFTWDCGDLVDLGNVLQIAGSSVKTLSITMDSRVDAATLPRCLNLSRSTGLCSFRLLARIEENHDDTTEFFWIPDCIAQLSSPSISIVRVHIEIRAFLQLSHVNWTRIDSVLSDTKSLTKVEVCVIRRWEASDEDDNQALGTITSSMPKLKSRGILDVMRQYS
ncbi:hypothetical protein BKA93DRAFT_751776 [Sparassis latifolia]